MKKDFRSVGQIYREMHEATIPKKTEKAVEKSLDSIDDPVEKLEALDGMVKKALGESDAYYAMKRAEKHAAKDGHDFHKLPEYDRGADKPHKEKYRSMAQQEALEFGTTQARDCYSDDTPGQSSGDPSHEPTHAMKAKYGLSVNGVPDKGGSMSKPDVSTTTGLKVEGSGTEAELVEEKSLSFKETLMSMATEGYKTLKDIDDGKPASKNNTITTKDKYKVKPIPGNPAYKGKQNPKMDEAIDYCDCGCDCGKKICTKCGKPKMEKDIREAAEAEMPSKEHIQKMCDDGKSAEEIRKMHPDCDQNKLESMIDDCSTRKEATTVPGFMGADGKPTFKPTKKDMDSNKEYQGMKKKGIFKKGKLKGVDEAMSVTLRKSKSQPGSYKVHSVGSKMKAHGGIKPGERVKDHEIDGMKDSQIAVKYRKEMTDYQKGLVEGKYSDKEVRMAKGIAFDKRHVAGDYTGAAKKMEKIKKGLSDHPKAKDALRRANEQRELAKELYGLQEISDGAKKSYINKANKEITSREKVKDKMASSWKGKSGAAITKYHDDKANKRRKGVAQARSGLTREAVERRADAKVIMATDPTTGKKVAKKAPRKEIEIGLGKDA